MKFIKFQYLCPFKSVAKESQGKLKLISRNQTGNSLTEKDEIDKQTHNT